MEVYFLETFPKEFDPEEHHSIVALNPVVAWSMQFYGLYKYITPDQLVYPEEVQMEMVKETIKEFYGNNCIFFQNASDVCRAEIYWRQFLIIYLRAIEEYNARYELSRGLVDPFQEIKFYYYCYHPPMYPIFHQLIRELIFERKKKCTGHI